MPVITATAVTLYAPISATVELINSSGLIQVVQDRINVITNNYFLTDIDLQSTMTFNATAGTIVAGASFEDNGFVADDEVYIYNSYRNDGYYTVTSVDEETLTIATTQSVVAELSGRSILASVVRWPSDLKYVAAQMVYFDYDLRADRSPGTTSVRLGPWSESYAEPGAGQFGYPSDVIAPLFDYKIARIRLCRIWPP